jgi:hypothetical protein
MDLLFPKPEVKKKPRSVLGEYLTEHQHELALISFLLGAYATIKVLLLQSDMDRMRNDTDARSHSREHRHHGIQCHSDDER